jgi:hypothetical protein
MFDSQLLIVIQTTRSLFSKASPFHSELTSAVGELIINEKQE